MKRTIGTTVLSFFLCSGFFCTAGAQGAHPVKILSDNASPFPLFEIPAANKTTVSLHSVSAGVGSIGCQFAENEKTYWLEGLPISANEKKHTYLWNLKNGSAVQLHLTYEQGDPVFHLQYIPGADKRAPWRWFVNIAGTKDGFYTGAMERVIDGKQENSWKEGLKAALNLEKRYVDVHLKPTVSAYAPFYVASSYGFFARGTWPGSFDFCREHEKSVGIMLEGPSLEFKLYFGTPIAIVQKHALETGPSVIPPAWALGPWRWRDVHTNRKKYFDSSDVHAPYNSEAVEDVLMMKALDIPCTAYWLDRPWGPGKYGYDDFTFDPDRFPNGEQMIKWFKKNGMETIMWIGPFVLDKLASETARLHYEVPTTKFDHEASIDFSSHAACAWWGKNGPARLAKMGVRGFKLDRADGETLVDTIHYTTLAGKSERENFNDYCRQYVKATYDAVSPILGKNMFLFPRAQYTGSAQYGGMWAGDTYGSEEGLRSVIIGMQRCAVMGYPLWGSDVGGWEVHPHEITKRWLEFGCFSPLMEVGPTNNVGYWNMVNAPTYDTSLIAVYRMYSKLRMKLIPYIQKLAVEAHKTGMPIARPLAILYPEQHGTEKCWQTYLLGPDILVTPAWIEKSTKLSVCLPEGSDWIDAWDTTKTHHGGTFIGVDVPSYKISLFIRKGSNIHLGDLKKLYDESLQIAATKPNMATLEQSAHWR